MNQNKRRKRSASCDLSLSEADGDAKNEDWTWVNKNPSPTEHGSSVGTTSRCSVRQLSTVIQTFDDVKNQLVHEIGFQGLLKINNFSTLNRQFSIWLLSNVDCDKHRLVFDEHRIIPFGPADVSHVFGIPCGDKDVLGSAAQISDKGLEYMRECIGLDAVNPRSLKSVQEFLLSDIGTEPTSFQKDCFKIAFVVFAMGSFLAPSAKHDYVSTSFWGALRATHDISTFNWGGYVIKALIESARRVQADLTNKRSVTSITGCHLFLQVLYLDNIWIPGLSTSHDVLPRIGAFSTDTLNAFIAVISIEDSFQIHELRDIRSVCYSRRQTATITMEQASNQRDTDMAGGNNVMDTKFSTPNPMMPHNTATASISHQPAETNVPKSTDLYHLIRDTYPQLARTELADMLKVFYGRTLKYCQTLQAKLLNENLVLANNILAMAQNGSLIQTHSFNLDQGRKATSRGSSGVGMTGKKLDLDETEGNSSARKKHYFPMPTNVVDAVRTGPQIPKSPRTMSQNLDTPTASEGSSNHQGRYMQRSSSLPPVDSSRSKGMHEGTNATTLMASVNLCMKARVTELSSKAAACGQAQGRIQYGQIEEAPIITQRIRKLGFEKPGWALGAMHPRHNPADADELFAWCKDDAQPYIRDTWVRHASPRFIHLEGIDIKRQIVQSDEMGCDMVDIIIRRFKQYDNFMHANAFEKRWRHFFESDFATYVLAGYHPLNVVHIRAQFIGTEVPYNLTSCRMFVIPAYIAEAWCIYMVDMCTRTTLVLDPYLTHNSTCKRQLLHEQAAPAVTIALFDCLKACFENWPLSYEKWCTHFPKLAIEDIHMYDSGVVMLHCTRNYTGEDLLHNLNRGEITKIRKATLVDLLTLDDNTAYVPAPRILHKFQ